MPPFEGLDTSDSALDLLDDDNARDILSSDSVNNVVSAPAVTISTPTYFIAPQEISIAPVTRTASITSISGSTNGATNGITNDPGMVYDVFMQAETGEEALNNSLLIPDDGEVGAPPPQVHFSPQIVPTDPGLSVGSGFYQWHLTGTNGIDAQGAWDNVTGKGVRIAVFDDGFQYAHSELSPNYKTNLDFDVSGNNDNDAAPGASDFHGTAVMGTLGADNNGQSVVGVAFDSELIGIRRTYDGNTGFADEVEAFQYVRTSGSDVVNNSWGSTMAFGTNALINYFGADTTEVLAEFVNLVNLGRGGLGTSIVFAAGNSRAQYANTNTDNYSNSPYVITVGATDSNGTISDFSTPGASILISAPGSGIWTTDRTGASGYAAGDIAQVQGTSFAAPIVSGVIALMYEANSELGYRDVQEILAYTARNDLNDADTVVNVDDFDQVHNAHVNGGRDFMFSHDFGYGLVDAAAAVRLAKTWTQQQTYGTLQTVNASATPNLTLNATGTFTSTINVASNIEIEKILINLVIPHAKAGDLVISLISPDGTESILVNRLSADGTQGSYKINPHGGYDGVANGINYQFSTSGHLGEMSAGTWTLKIVDAVAGNGGTLSSWSLQFLGNSDSANDTYVFNDNLSGNITITDASGTDTLNFSPLGSGVTVNLNSGATALGHTITIANGTVIENLYATDFNDTVTDGTGNNMISLGAGNDTLTAGTGSDTYDGGAGNDTVIYGTVIGNYTIENINATTVRVTDNIGQNGVDTISNFETFRFNGVDYTFAQMQALGNSVDVTDVVLKFGWGTTIRNIVSGVTESRTLTAAELGLPGHTGNAAQFTRTSNSLAVTNLNLASTAIETFSMQHLGIPSITVDGFRNNVILQSAATSAMQVTLTRAMYGRVDTGSGNDTINVSLQETVAATAIQALRLSGGAGDDTIIASGTHTKLIITVYGGDGNDTITINNAGAHVINGDAGNDIINGSVGNEKLYGGLGDDTINANNGNDVVLGGDGADTIYGGNGNDNLQGEDGNDIIYGDAGVDTIRGGAGLDTIYGGANNDLIYGDDGDDTIYGDAGTDSIVAGAGNDTIYGGNEWDKLWGDDGNDTIYGGAGNDIIYGGNHNDTLNGDADNDKLFAGTGDDTLNGGAGVDYLYGEDGNDILNGGDGVDYMWGGAGADRFTFSSNPATGMDRIMDFNYAQLDRIDVSAILQGFTPGVDDIDSFVRVIERGGNRADIQVNLDGAGNDWANLAIVYGTLTGHTAQQLYDAGQLIAV